MEASRTAFVIGGSGLIGSALVGRPNASLAFYRDTLRINGPR